MAEHRVSTMTLGMGMLDGVPHWAPSSLDGIKERNAANSQLIQAVPCRAHSPMRNSIGSADAPDWARGTVSSGRRSLTAAEFLAGGEEGRRLTNMFATTSSSHGRESPFADTMSRGTAAFGTTSSSFGRPVNVQSVLLWLPQARYLPTA